MKGEFSLSQDISQENRMMIYSHDTFGLGHYRRNLLISSHLLKHNPQLSIVLVTGSPIAGRFSVKGKFDFIKMPSVIKTGVEQYASRNFICPYETIKSCREQIILNVAHHFQPNIFLADHSPIGVKGELIPTLEYLQKQGFPCRRILGLRDILDEPDSVKKIWKEENIYQSIEKYYDDIFIYGLKELFNVVDEYLFSSPLKEKTTYTGYIYGGTPKRQVESVKEQLRCNGKPLVLVIMGGGDDGFPVAKNYLEMIRKYKKEIQFYSYLVTGPLMKIEEREMLMKMTTPGLVKIAKFERDVIGTIIAADLVISMGGYNSICEILQFAQRAVIIPRVYPRKEQYIRGRILQDRKLLTLLLPDELNPDRLYDLISNGLNSGTQTQILQRKVLLKTNGLDHLNHLLFGKVS